MVHSAWFPFFFLKRGRGALFIAKEVLGLRLGLSPNPN